MWRFPLTDSGSRTSLIRRHAMEKPHRWLRQDATHLPADGSIASALLTGWQVHRFHGMAAVRTSRHLCDLCRGRPPASAVIRQLRPADPSWSPDSRFLAYGTWPAVIDSHSGSQQPDLQRASSKEPLLARWSPDGNYIVANSSHRNLWLYSVAQKQWRPLPALGGSEAWSHDSKFVYALDLRRIVRVNITTNKRENVIDLGGIRFTSFGLGAGSWFSLTPDDSIMILRDTGSEEIYALQLEY